MSGMKILLVSLLMAILLVLTLAFGVAVGEDSQKKASPDISDFSACEVVSHTTACLESDIRESMVLNDVDDSEFHTLRNWCRAVTTITCEKEFFKLSHPGIPLDMPIF